VRVGLVIPAAGAGTRLGCTGPKALVDIGGRPLLVRTLARFAGLGLVSEAVVVVSREHEGAIRAALSEFFPDERFRFVHGGAERQDSVRAALDALPEGVEIVAIHDAARPFVPPASVRASIEAAAECGAATVAIRAIDTILESDGGEYLEATPERKRMWACQTPQTFRVEVIRAAYAHAAREGFLGTDDASLVRRMGGRVRLVAGSVYNLKVTTPGDLSLALAIHAGGLAEVVEH